MGKLIIDANSVYEIDEECLKHNVPPLECGIYEQIQAYNKQNKHVRGNHGGKESHNRV